MKGIYIRYSMFKLSSIILNRSVSGSHGWPLLPSFTGYRFYSDKKNRRQTPKGKLDQPVLSHQEQGPTDAYAPFPGGINPSTGEIGGPKGPEPTRYGDWERKGRVSDF